jgi:hypothetical protein
MDRRKEGGKEGGGREGIMGMSPSIATENLQMY